MEKTGWKTTAIIFIVLFTFLLTILYIGSYMVNIEEQREFECNVACGTVEECAWGVYDLETEDCIFVTKTDLKNYLVID